MLFRLRQKEETDQEMNRPGGGETRVIEEASRYLLNRSEQQYVVWHPWSRGHMEGRAIGKKLESDPGSQ